MRLCSSSLVRLPNASAFYASVGFNGARESIGPRRTFTLKELLIVVTIVCLIFGIVVPAVQQSRAAARRAECANNLKQIQIAALISTDARRMFASGYESKIMPTGDDLGPGWGLCLIYLPYIEQIRFLAELQRDEQISSPQNTSVRLRNLPIFNCPADCPVSPWTVVARDSSGVVTQTICEISASNYIGMCGTVDMFDNNDGMYFRNSRILLDDVSDGTSYTIAIGERSQNLGPATWVGVVPGARLFPDKPGLTPRVVKHGSGMTLGRAGVGHGPGSPKSEVDEFQSRHRGGVNFVFVDGHAEFLSSEMDAGCFRAMATRAGGDRISP